MPNRLTFICIIFQIINSSCTFHHRNGDADFKVVRTDLNNFEYQKPRKGIQVKPLIIGHRGASGHTPEHTLHAYQLAIEMGADYFEPDLVITKDGVLIARHENEISETTNVAEIYPERKTTKWIDNKKVVGYFAEDFTLTEIKKLKTKERLSFRNQKENGIHSIATFEEILNLRIKLSEKFKKIVGVAPELKHSTYFLSINMPLEKPFIEIINKYKLNVVDAPIMVQSFEISNLKYLKSKLPNVQLVQLLDEVQEMPADQTKVTYAQMATYNGLKDIAKYASWVSPWKPYILPIDSKDKKLLKPTGFIQIAHSLGLKVVPYTFRNEDQYLSKDDQGSPESEYMRFYVLGVDAVFSDFPDTAHAAREKYYKKAAQF